MTVEKLKPCPFCGHEAVIEGHDPFFVGIEPEYMAVCTWCSGNSGWYSTPDEAADAWNIRAKQGNHMHDDEVYIPVSLSKLREIDRVLALAYDYSTCSIDVVRYPSLPQDKKKLIRALDYVNTLIMRAKDEALDKALATSQYWATAEAK